MEFVTVPQVLAMALWLDFMMHQGSHGMYAYSAGAGLAIVLNLYSFLGTLAGLAFLVVFGYRTVWYAPLALLGFGIVGGLILRAIERRLGLLRAAWTISLVGLVGIPVVLVFLFSTLP